MVLNIGLYLDRPIMIISVSCKDKIHQDRKRPQLSSQRIQPLRLVNGNRLSSNVHYYLPNKVGV